MAKAERPSRKQIGELSSLLYNTNVEDISPRDYSTIIKLIDISYLTNNIFKEHDSKVLKLYEILRKQLKPIR